MSKEAETVTVSIEVPKGVIDFLKTFGVDTKRYLEDVVLHCFGADLTAFRGDPTVFIDWARLMEKHRFREIPLLADYPAIKENC